MVGEDRIFVFEFKQFCKTQRALVALPLKLYHRYEQEDQKANNGTTSVFSFFYRYEISGSGYALAEQASR